MRNARTSGIVGAAVALACVAAAVWDAQRQPAPVPADVRVSTAAPFVEGPICRSAVPGLSQVLVDSNVRSEVVVEGLDGRTPQAGADLRLRVRLTDATTGASIAGHRPIAWLTMRRNDQVAEETSCRTKIKTLLSGRLSARPDVDLNGYRLFVVDRDRAIAVVNPEGGFKGANLEAVIPLPGEPGDAAASPNGRVVAVALPGLSSVALVDTERRMVTRIVGLPPDARPATVVFEPLRGGARAIVGLAGRPEVAVVDPESASSPRTVSVGVGPHHVIAGAGAATLLVAAEGDHSVSVIGRETLALERRIAVPDAPVDIVFDPVHALIYVALADRAAIAVVNPVDGTVTTLPLQAAASRLALDRRNQLLLAVMPAVARAAVLDLATQKLAASISVPEGADEVHFTDDDAYVRGTEAVAIYGLIGLRNGTPSRIDIPTRSGKVDAAIAGAHLMTRMPDGHGMLIANPAERVAYGAMEGMNAPVGIVQLHTPHALAMLAIDQGLRETLPGHFEAIFKVPRGGSYDVPMLVDGGTIARCPTLEVKAGPAEVAVKSAILGLEPIASGPFGRGQRGRIAVRVTGVDARPVTDLDGVTFLAFRDGGLSQQRRSARREGDTYSTDWVFRESGHYTLMVMARGDKQSEHPRQVGPLYFDVRDAADGDGLTPRRTGEVP